MNENEFFTRLNGQTLPIRILPEKRQLVYAWIQVGHDGPVFKVFGLIAEDQSMPEEMGGGYWSEGAVRAVYNLRNERYPEFPYQEFGGQPFHELRVEWSIETGFQHLRLLKEEQVILEVGTEGWDVSRHAVFHYYEPEPAPQEFCTCAVPDPGACGFCDNCSRPLRG